jgi:predicted dehydrogenases and related proteins
MHYVDIARWYARSEYKTWNAQAVRMWNYKDPWWLQCHGTFENGVVFDITQGHVYGQLAKDQTHNSYIDIIGTKGIARMTHDFKTAVVELHGVTQTHRIERPFGGKNIDVLCDLFAQSLETGVRNESLPSFRDAAIASEYAWRFLQDARTHDMPAIGDLGELEEIRDRRRTMKNGYGLLRKRA